MKKTLCALLACFVVLCGVSACRADYDNEGRDGFTEAGAYLIDSIDDLKLLRDRVNAATEPENRYYRLEIDMNLTQETTWEPIGYANPFRGHFDGNGHTIYLNVTRTSGWYDSYFDGRYTNSHLAGLFGYISSSGYAVKNLNINATQISATHSGGIAYRIDAGTIDNCHFTGTINTAYYAGGIIGYLNGGTVKNCTVNAFVSSSVHSETTYIGGIVGNMTGGNIENCEVLSGAAIGARTDSTSSLACGGGIVGYANIALYDTIKDCKFNAAAGSLARAYYDIDSHRNNSNVYCGGIVGHLTGGTLQNNHVLSDADIFSDYTAGDIAGQRPAQQSKAMMWQSERALRQTVKPSAGLSASSTSGRSRATPHTPPSPAQLHTKAESSASSKALQPASPATSTTVHSTA